MNTTDEILTAIRTLGKRRWACEPFPSQERCYRLHVLTGRPAQVGVARVLQPAWQNRLWAVQLLPIMTEKPKKENCYTAATRKEPASCQYEEDTCTLMRIKKITGEEFKSHDKTSKENSSVFFSSILIESVWKANLNFKRSNRRKQQQQQQKKQRIK